MTQRVVVGTRRSRLARAQTTLVTTALARRYPSVRFAELPLATSGDLETRRVHAPDFTDTIDRALLRGEVDLAVHSAKDLPLALPAGLELAATPLRADPRDCLVVGPREGRPGLPRGARVGSSSPRRRAQLLRWRPDLEVVEMRGNVDRRLDRLRSGSVDAVILAVAGLERLGLRRRASRLLPVRDFLPAPAQGALAIVVRSADRRSARLARSVDDPATHAAVRAERAFASAVGGDCRVPVAALARVHGREIEVAGEVLDVDGQRRVRATTTGRAADAARLGERLGRVVLEGGGRAVLRRARS